MQEHENDAVPRNLAIVVMGVAGCGKSTFGRALADGIGGGFVEGDDLHPGENVGKMRVGIPLTDEDRRPWLDECGRALARSGDVAVVLACSALRRSYRDQLRQAVASSRRLLFLWLRISRADAAARVAGREDHFMPAPLVASQFEALEAPDPEKEPDVMVVDGTLPTPEAAEEAIKVIAATS